MQHPIPELASCISCETFSPLPFGRPRLFFFALIPYFWKGSPRTISGSRLEVYPILLDLLNEQINVFINILEPNKNGEFSNSQCALTISKR
jgi:hypothetical protein